MQGKTAAQYILLYYKYVDLSAHQEEVHSWFLELCSTLRLVGRVRVALDGINVTVGGTQSAVQQHVEAVQGHPLFGTDIDFKLARSEGPRSEQATRESGFDSLQVSKCQEVVSLGADSHHVPPAELPQAAAEHIKAQEWHQLLASARVQGGDSKLVLLDVRNLYETRIGHFQAEGVELVDPQLRCFMDLPAWLTQNKKDFEGSKVLMYCTGGVRCERASALLRSMGHKDVVQLSGGIQRYMDAFPDGGFFQGRNFVFDERVSVGPSGEAAASVVGRCLLCSAACDDYGHRHRCQACRMLVLVCEDCSHQPAEAGSMFCELCQRRALPKSLQRPRLRILCLHGFRQNSSSLRGRLAGLAKRLQNEAELVFVDAPHQLPALFKPAEQHQGEHGALPPGVAPGRTKRAWLVEPSYLASDCQQQKTEWRLAPNTFDMDQFKRQTAGWPASWEAFQVFLREQGPFDGCLGFSQGAAIAAVLCGLQQEQQQQMQGRLPGTCTAEVVPSENGASALAEKSSPGCAGSSLSFRFAVLCSGYLSRAPEHQQLQAGNRGLIALPSLHVYGVRAHDRQICTAESEGLAAAFCEEGRVVLTHDFGHFVPKSKQHIALYREFFRQFL